MPFFAVAIFKLLVPLLCLIIGCPALPWIDEVCHRPPVDRYRGQWIEIVNPDGNALATARLRLRCGTREKSIVPWPTSSVPGGGVLVSVVPARSRFLLFDRGMGETIAPRVAGVPVFTTDSESLADGSFLAAGDELALLVDGREVDRVTLGETPPEKSWVRLFSQLDLPSSLWASSLGDPTPGLPGADDPSYGDGDPVSILWKGVPACLVLGRPVFGDFRLINQNGLVTRQWGRRVSLAGDGRIKATAYEDRFKTSADSTWNTLPFQLGRSPLFALCPSLLGPFKIETSLPGGLAILPGFVVPFDSPLAKKIWFNEVRSSQGESIPFVEIAAQTRLAGPFAVELWNDDLKSVLRFAFIPPANDATVLALSPLPLPSGRNLVIEGIRPYAEGRIVLLDGNDRVIDVAITRKSSWGLMDGDSLHRLHPSTPAFAKSDWAPSSPSWPPSPGEVDPITNRGSLRLTLARNIVSHGVPGVVALFDPAEPVELSSDLWAFDARTCFTLVPPTIMAAGQSRPLTLAQIQASGFDRTGLFVLRVATRELATGVRSIHRRCLEFRP